MTDILTVRLLPPVGVTGEDDSSILDCEAQWLRSGAEGAPTPDVGRLSELLQQPPADCQWVVLLPGEDVLTTTVKLPAKRRRQALKALPYLLEDSIASDAALEHVAVGPDTPDGATLVAITRKAQLHDLLAQMREAGVTPQQVFPDYALLTESPDTWQILVSVERALVRCPDGTGFSTPVSRLPLLLNSLQPAQGDESRRRVNWIRTADTAVPGLAADWQVSEHVVSDPLVHLASGLPGAPLNLLQGEFKVNRQNGRHWRQWSVAASLALAAVCFSLLETGLETFNFNRENERLQASIMEMAREALPGIRQIRDPQAQLLIAWRQLQNGGGEAEFLPLLNRIAPAVSRQPVTVQGINFKNGSLTLVLQGNSLQQLDDLRLQIEQQGLDAVMMDAGTDADSAHGSLVIKAGDGQPQRSAG